MQVVQVVQVVQDVPDIVGCITAGNGNYLPLIGRKHCNGHSSETLQQYLKLVNGHVGRITHSVHRGLNHREWFTRFVFRF